MAKKVLSILCAIAMMVTMLSVGMVSVLAADNLGTVTRVEKSFGSLAWADSTYSETGTTYANAGQKYYAFFNTEATDDAIMGRGANVAVTLTNKATATLGDEFAFSFKYSYYQNATYRLMPYANIAIGGMNIRVQTVEDDTTNTAPTVAITYGDASLSVKATSYVAYTAEEITAMFNAGKASQVGQYAPTTWTNESVVPNRYVDVDVRYANGTLTLNVSGATDSVAADIDITNATVAYTVGNDAGASNVGVGLSNWEGSYYSEEFIEGDAGEGEEGGDDTVEYINFGSFAWADSTYSETGAAYANAAQKYYAFFNTEATDDALMGRGRNVSVTLTNNATATLGDDFEFSFRYSYYHTGAYRLIPYANIAIGGMNIRVQALADASSNTDSAPTAVLTYGDTTLSAKTTDYGAYSTEEVDAMYNAGKEAQQTGVTFKATTWNGNYVVGNRYVDVNVKYQDGTLTLSVAGSGAAATDSKAVTLDMTDVAVAATIGDGDYLVGVGLSNWSGKYAKLPEVEVDPYAPNIENGTDLLDPTTLTGNNEVTDDIASNNNGISKNVYTAADKATMLTLDNYALWSKHYGNQKTVTSTTAYNFGTNFEVSTYMLVVNQAGNPTSANMALGDVKLTFSRDASSNVTITLVDGSTTLGTIATTSATIGDATQFRGGVLTTTEPNGTYTFKYDGTNLTVKRNGTVLVFDNGLSAFPMDASKFSGVNYSAGVVSNGRAAFITDAIYTNLTPVVDKDLAFCGAGLTLGNGIGIEFYVNPAVYANYTDVVASVTYTGSENAETYTLKDLSGYKGFTFDKYSPDQYDEFVFVQLSAKKNGALVEGNTVKYSVANYISNQRKNQSSNTKLMSVIDALEAYCVAFDAYIDGEEYTYAGEAVELTKENDYHMNKATIDNPAFAFTGCTLNFREAPTVLYAFSTTEDVNDYTFKITKQDGSVAEIAGEDFVEAGDGVYYVYYRGVTATEMRNTITGQMFNGDAAASDAITYSVVSYAYYQYQKAEKTILYDVTQAMMAYGDAVCVYAGQ